MSANKIELKQQHLLEVDKVFTSLCDVLNIKQTKKKYISLVYLFKLVKAKNPIQSSYEYRKTNGVNKKIVEKLEYIKKLLDI